MPDGQVFVGETPWRLTKEIQMFGLQTPQNYNRMVSS